MQPKMTKPSPWGAFLLILCAIFMDLLVGMEFDLFVPSFPLLQHTFDLSPSQVEALLSVNFLGYCLGIPLVGTLSDRHGRKPLILWGLGLFILGSLLCLFGENYGMLISGRLIQGLGISAPGILSFLIIADKFPLKKQQTLMGLLNASMNLACALAPVLGSFLTLYFGWKGNFTALLILGVFSLFMVCFAFKEEPKIKTITPQIFSIRQDYRKMLSSKPLRLLMFYIIAMVVPYWIFVGMSPLLYMKELGVSLAHFGYYQGLQAFSFAVGSLIFGIITHQVSHRKFLIYSNILAGLSLIILLSLAIFKIQSAPWLTFGLLLFVIGQIVPSSILYTLSLNMIPEIKGSISGFIQGMRLILSALSLQLAAWTYDGTFFSTGLIISGFMLFSIFGLWAVLKHPVIRLLIDQ
jgi:DHA1 family bicyclomycin/chloramphenicol resistance-like MFS transporter